MKVIGFSLFPRSNSKGYEGAFVSLGTICPGCQKPTAVLAKRTSGNGAMDQSFINQTNTLVSAAVPIRELNLHLIDYWPKPIRPNVPEHLPEPVAKAFLQAEKNFAMEGHEEAAGMMYRRSLELALALKYPDIQGGLAQIIKQLADSNVLTSDISAWATDIRLIGNIAAHDVEVTREDLEMMRGFADAVLKYIWTLPTQVQQRRKAQSDGGAVA